MPNLINISSQIDSILNDEVNKIHTNRKISGSYNAINPAAKEAIDINTFDHFGVSQDEVFVNKRGYLIRLHRRRSMHPVLS